MTDLKTVIIGAGITGLALGRLLPESVIYEKSTFIGGFSRTIHYQGFHFDVGLHSLPELEPEVQEFLNPFLQDVLTLPHAETKIAFVKNGGLSKGAPHPLNFNFNNDPLLALGLRASYYFRRIFPRKVHRQRDHSINLHGDLYHSLFTRNFIEKWHGISDQETFFPKLPESSQEPFIPRLIRWLLRKGKRPPQKPREISYPFPWFGAMVDKLSEGLPIRLSSELTRILFSGKRAVGIEINQRENIPCNRLILTSPPNFLIHLFNPPKEIARIVPSIRYRDLMYVVLFFEKDYLMERPLIITFGKEIFARAVEPKRWNKALSPEGKTSICFEIPCFQGDPLWRLSDEEVKRKVFEDFTQSHPAPEPFDGLVYRIPRVWPIYDSSFEPNLKTVYAFMSQFENIHFPSFALSRYGSSVSLSIQAALGIARTIQPLSSELNSQILEN